MSSQESPGTSGNPPEQVPPQRRSVTVRRAPRYVPFLILGALLGVVAAAVVAFGFPGEGSYDPGAVFGFFMILFGLGGAVLGGIAALLLDHLSVRRARHAVVEPVDGPEAEAEDTGGRGAEHDGGKNRPAGG